MQGLSIDVQAMKFTAELLRLCRPMCGRLVAFRESPLQQIGAMPRGAGAARNLCAAFPGKFETCRTSGGIAAVKRTTWASIKRTGADGADAALAPRVGSAVGL